MKICPAEVKTDDAGLVTGTRMATLEVPISKVPEGLDWQASPDKHSPAPPGESEDPWMLKPEGLAAKVSSPTPKLCRAQFLLPLDAVSAFSRGMYVIV